MTTGAGNLTAARAAEDGRFWERVAALFIDTALVYWGLIACEEALSRTGIYIQFELAFGAVAASYATACVTWKGRTIGKALCGLAVRRRDGENPGLARALVREFAGKSLSAAPFLLGFFWASLGSERRAWHDSIARTRVVRRAGARSRARIAAVASLLALGLLAGAHAWEIADMVFDARTMAPVSLAAPPDRIAPPLTEVSSIGESEDRRFVEWLDQHGAAPADYAVSKAVEHEIVVFGETHWKKEPLRFLNELIPRLYESAGVTCIAMEACLAEDNPEIERLVTGREYDDDLAMQIARHHSSRRWGWKGYWDVFATVWRLNQSVPRGKPKIRVIGLDVPIDLPSLALAGIGDGAVDGPFLERLRIVRVAGQLPRLLLRDALMAREVEREILSKGEKGIVWVGFAHSTVRCPNPGPRGFSWGRMGFMLRQKHGDSIFQILLHDADVAVTTSDPRYRGQGATWAEFVERIMTKRGGAPVAFDTSGSPFELLRDSGSWTYHFDPRSCLGVVATGYLYLAAERDLGRCDWLPGYVTAEMFLADKPYYQALARGAGKVVHDANETDLLLRRL